MTEYQGFTSFPQKLRVTLAVLVLVLSALAATLYSVASCRFVTVEYSSQSLQFWSYRFGAAQDVQNFKFGAGLFSWLEPDFTNPNEEFEYDWTNGSCVGYAEKLREVIGDVLFEAARILAVCATLFGIGVAVWVSTLVCFSIGARQVLFLVALQVLLCILTCLLFLVLRSGLCTEVGVDTTCSLDVGGFIAIAGAIFWLAAAIVTARFVKSPERETDDVELEKYPRDASLTNNDDDDQDPILADRERDSFHDEEEPMTTPKKDSRSGERTSAPVETPDTAISITSGITGGEEEEGLEVYLPELCR